MNAIEITGLTKKFGEFTAVDGINLDISEGELFGLLGPNGAGKTTTINMLATISDSTSGDAKVNGFPINEKDKVRKSIGIVFQDPSLDDELTGRENLDFHGRLYHMPNDIRKKRIDDMLKLVDLEGKANNKTRTYSGGMKRRLEIARGLMHHPKILFLDEPTLGLDPQTRRNIWDHIEKLKEKGLTIILTTHYMEEADYLCDRVAIIDNGKIVALDTPENLKLSMGGDIITLDTDGEKLKGFLDMSWIKEMKIIDGKLDITVTNSNVALPLVLSTAEKNGISIKSVSLKKPTLEDVFIKYTGHTIREEEASQKDILKSQVKGEWKR